MRSSTSTLSQRLATLAAVFVSMIAVAGDAPESLGTVGMRVIEVTKPSSGFQLLSVPFLKPPTLVGRLSGTSGSQVRIADEGQYLTRLEDSVSYLLRIRSGPERGAWFTIEPAGGRWANSQGHTVVTNDGLAGNLGAITGNESFSIHPLFTIAELFPEQSGPLPSGKVDVLATQIHMLETGGYAKYWLSDGTITDTAGWYAAGPSGLRPAGSDVILPGRSFFVVLPEPAQETIAIRVFGDVLSDAIRVPVPAGYNLVSALYNVSQVDEGGKPSFDLQDMGLAISGFASSTSANNGDQLLLFDNATLRFNHGFWLQQDGSTPQWRNLADSTPSGTTELDPGGGFVVWNRGAAYWWKQGKE